MPGGLGGSFCNAEDLLCPPLFRRLSFSLPLLVQRVRLPMLPHLHSAVPLRTHKAQVDFLQLSWLRATEINMELDVPLTELLMMMSSYGCQVTSLTQAP